MTAERYTAVFTGLLSIKKPGEYPYLRVDGESSGTLYRGEPPYESMGREVSFPDLPEEPQRVILETYRRLWNL